MQHIASLIYAEKGERCNDLNCLPLIGPEDFPAGPFSSRGEILLMLWFEIFDFRMCY
jgi:hypothetical protein